MEVLQQGDDDEPRLRLQLGAGRRWLDPGRRWLAPHAARREVRLAGLAVAALAVAGLGLSSLRTTAPTSAPAAPAASQPRPDSAAATGPLAPPAPLPADALAESDYVLLSGPQGVRRLTLRTGASVRVSLPTGFGPATPAALVALPAVAAVVAAPPVGEMAIYNASTFLIDPTGAARPVGASATTFVGADGRSLWLQEVVGAGARRLRHVDAAGRLLSTVALPPSTEAVGEVAAGLVVQRPAPSGRLAVELWDRGRSPAMLRRIAEAGVVLSVSGDLVLHAPCPERCGLRVSEVTTDSRRWGEDMPMGRPVELGARPHVGSVRIAPDERHVAAVVDGEAKGSDRTYDVVVGHLPGGAWAGATRTVLAGLSPAGGVRRPRLSYTSSGWLVVSTGDRLYVVGPGPHRAYVLPGTPPVHGPLDAG